MVIYSGFYGGLMGFIGIVPSGYVNSLLLKMTHRNSGFSH